MQTPTRVHGAPVVRDLAACERVSGRHAHDLRGHTHREAHDGMQPVLLEVDVERLEERDVPADVVRIRRVREVLAAVRCGRVRRGRGLHTGSAPSMTIGSGTYVRSAEEAHAHDKVRRRVERLARSDQRVRPLLQLHHGSARTPLPQ
jgi:hypothetical protein